MTDDSRGDGRVRRRGAGLKLGGWLGLAAMLTTFGAPVAVAQDQTPPYWASIAADRAILRRGPSRDMRALWEYRRPGLPLKVIAVHEDWRRVRELDGTTGWVHRSLITGRRMAIVTTDRAAIRASGDAGAAVQYRAMRGVVGRVSNCDASWCAFDVLGRRGWIATADIWGDDRD